MRARGKVVRSARPESLSPSRWAERENLTDMRRVTVAVRRRESADGVARGFCRFRAPPPAVHPRARARGPPCLEQVLEQLQAVAAPAPLWESEILPRRVKDYRPAWLDDLLGTRNLALASGSRRPRPGAGRVLSPREFDGRSGRSLDSETELLERNR